MTLTREEAATLRPGDVVEVRPVDHEGVVVTGPLRAGMWQSLMCGPQMVVSRDGQPAAVEVRVLRRVPEPRS